MTVFGSDSDGRITTGEIASPEAAASLGTTAVEPPPEIIDRPEAPVDTAVSDDAFLAVASISPEAAEAIASVTAEDGPLPNPAVNGTVERMVAVQQGPMSTAELAALAQKRRPELVPEPEPEVRTFDDEWEHDYLVFRGDKLAIRKPTQAALIGFSLASGRYIDSGVKNDITGLFIVEHLGPESYGQIMRRLMDGQDPDYTTHTIGEIMSLIIQAATASMDLP